MSNQYVFNDRLPLAPLKIAALESCRDLAQKVNDHIVNFRRNDTEELIRRQGNLQYRGYDVDSYLLDCACPRFGSGEAKGIVNESVRGTDIFCMVDVTNHSLTYKMSGYVNHMSPDDHYQDLKRIIGATASTAHLFERLRYAGQRAETAMFSATGGINTHKGLVFASAILCGALGKVHAGRELPLPFTDVLQECRRLGKCSLADLHRPPNVQPPLPTNGERIYTAYGIRGARGEAAAGFPSAVRIGLPALRKWLSSGFSLNDSAAMALLTLISEVDDTNMVHRGGPELAKKRKEQAKILLSAVTKENFKETLYTLDHQYMTENLSPGGCADLLAVSLMFHFLSVCGMISFQSHD